MDTVETYARHVEEVIESYAHYTPAYGDVEVQTVCDRTHHHYHVLTVGWDGHERIRGTILHIDIKDGKIWIQHDGTDVGVANELVARGVPKHDIVLAFHAPYKRPYTDFAVG
jgi:hypothetical protein